MPSAKSLRRYEFVSSKISSFDQIRSTFSVALDEARMTTSSKERLCEHYELNEHSRENASKDKNKQGKFDLQGWTKGAKAKVMKTRNDPR